MAFGLSRVEHRTIQATDWGTWPGDASQVWAGVRVDRDSAIQLLTVYGCVRLICDSIATLPIDVYRDTGDGAKVEVNKPPWLLNPVPGLDRVAWTTQVLSSVLLDGNAWIAVTEDSQGRVMELVPLDAQRVTVRRENTRRVVYIDGKVTALKLLHIPGLMLAGSDVGLSPIEYAKQSIGLGLAAQEFGARFFGQGANMSGVIENPGELTPSSARVMADSFAKRHSGLKKSHLPGVLVNGATWKSTGVTNDQAQFLESRQYTASEISAQMFLVDPTEFGLGMHGNSVTYANLEQRNAHLMRRTLLPWIVRLENALSSLLAQPRYVKYNVNGLLRGDLKSRYESYQVGIAAGFLGTDEAREFEDLPPRDDLQPAAMAATPNTGDGNGN